MLQNFTNQHFCRKIIQVNDNDERKFSRNISQREIFLENFFSVNFACLCQKFISVNISYIFIYSYIYVFILQLEDTTQGDCLIDSFCDQSDAPPDYKKVYLRRFCCHHLLENIEKYEVSNHPVLLK